MSAGYAEFHAWGQRVDVFVYLVFSADTAAAQIVAGIDQDAKRPGDKGRLPAKTGNASLDFQEGFLLASKLGFARQAAPRSFAPVELLHHVAQVFGGEIGPALGQEAELGEGAFP
jgi:hypothetical protein